MLKKLLMILLAVAVVLPIVLYVAIVITNNGIADRIEKLLASHELPENTVLVDSLSVAGKLAGNGNGMQYMGAILIESDLSAEELTEYYSSDFDYIEVREQRTAELDFINAHHSFSGFKAEAGKNYYSVTCWDDDRAERFNGFIVGLLDLDLRGH